jgi:Ca2+-transporting ATPase
MTAERAAGHVTPTPPEAAAPAGRLSSATAPAWHTLPVETVFEALGSRREGLTTEETETRLRQHGPNTLPEAKGRTLVGMIADQFKDFMVLLLIAAAIISGLIGEAKDTVAILVIVVLNATIGVVQEFRAERAMDLLKKLAAPTATARRNGQTAEVPAELLVPGDLVLLETGRIVPADVRLLEAAVMRTAEAMLTGESLPVDKTVDPLDDPEAPVGDRRNMAYSGTQVVYGRGVGVVTATGLGTELGKIAELLGTEKEAKTPLQRRLAVLGRNLGIAVLMICAVVFVVGLLRGEEVGLMFLTAVSLAVAAVPEALPAVVTITLALGARRMVHSHALMRRLPAVETLGSVTYVCSDKTGTLTQNRMKAERFLVDGSPVEAVPTPLTEPWTWLVRASALCNDVSGSAEAETGAAGDPTEVAFYELAAQCGYRREDVEREWPRVDELPFDSERKCMTTLHAAPGGGWVSFTKGAAELLTECCPDALADGGTRPVDRDRLHRQTEAMAADGVRVLALAMRRWEMRPASLTPEETEQNLTFLGLVGLLDPPRPEAEAAVHECRSAGIVPVMVTGDHPATALAIGRRLGIAGADDGVLTGRELESLSDEEFQGVVGEVRVYARVAPEQKVRIVKALQEAGQFVAMTGDGVNDAPALKCAEIGVAMGITGTDVSKESADMILLDDNFATIVAAVREGRRVYDNIRRFVRYATTSNSGEIWTIFLAPFFGLPIPLLPIHILWINLVTDGLPGLALAAEPAEKDVMRRPPRPPQESVFAQGLGAQIIWVGLLMAACSLGTQAWAIHLGNGHWQTMVFTVLCVTQLANVLALRSERQSLFRQGLLSNRPLFGAVVLTVALQFAVIYVPFLQPIFKTAPLSLPELLGCLGVSTVVFWAVELDKWRLRRASRKREGRS